MLLRDLLRLTGRFYDLLHRKPGFVKTHSPLGRAGYNQQGGEGISGQAKALFFYLIKAGEQAVRQVQLFFVPGDNRADAWTGRDILCPVGDFIFQEMKILFADNISDIHILRGRAGCKLPAAVFQGSCIDGNILIPAGEFPGLSCAALVRREIVPDKETVEGRALCQLKLPCQRIQRGKQRYKAFQMYLQPHLA